MRLKPKKGFLILLYMMLFTVLLPGVPHASAQERITVMTNIAPETMEPYIHAFERSNPDISVDYQVVQDYENTMQQYMEDGTMGDVVFIPGYASSASYTSYFEPLGEASVLSEKYRFINMGIQSDGLVYGIPHIAYASGFIYNKRIFREAGVEDTPKSIEEFLAALRKIKENTDAVPLYTYYTLPWAQGFWINFPYLEMTGDPDYRYGDFLYLKSPFREGTPHYQVYRMLYDSIREGLTEENPLADDWDLSKQQLNNGEIACMALGSWALYQTKQAGPHPEDVAFMPFPQEIMGKQYMTISGDYAYGISAQSTHKEAARRYIDFMLEESGYAQNMEVIPILKATAYPNSYGDMQNIILDTNADPGENYSLYYNLSQGFPVDDSSIVQRILDAGYGFSGEDFSSIIEDINRRWEAARPSGMEEKLKDDWQPLSKPRLLLRNIRLFLLRHLIPCIIILNSTLLLVLLQLFRSYRRRLQRERKEAATDPLTGLYNRSGFQEALQQLPKEGVWLYAITDIDNFKAINDAMGHLGGDRAIRLFTEKLSSVFPAPAVLGRFGGDEFVLCLPGGTERAAREKLAALVKASNCIVSFEGKEHEMSISVGAVLFPAGSLTEQVFMTADQALYAVKNTTKNGWQLEVLENS